MWSWILKIWDIYNPFDQHKYIKGMSDSILAVANAVESIRKDTNDTILALENQLKNSVWTIEQLINSLPDMVWVKSLDGKYIYANTAIREQLLLCPNPIGMTDVQLANKAKEFYGPENHTFGEKCANSDIITLGRGEPSRFLESGKVKGKMMYLEVFKAPIYDIHGSLVGVCGTGRVLTEYIEAVKAINCCSCDIPCAESVKTMVNIFSKYQFGEEE